MSLAERIEGTTSIAREVVSEIREHNVPFMAGSVAYSAFVSLFPLLLLSLLVASAIGGRELADFVLAYTGNYLTPTGQNILTDAILRAGERTEVTIIGVLVLGWGVLKVFRSLDTAFSTLYRTRRANDLADQLREGVTVLGATALAVAAIIVASAAFALFPLAGFLNPLLLVVGLTIAFFPVYYVYPDRRLSVTDVLPGTAFAAVGWATLQAVFQVYVSFSSTAEVYGVIGGVLLIITWLYFAAFVLLVGATINVTLMRQRGRGNSRHAPA